jgi:hypothetical protein
MHRSNDVLGCAVYSITSSARPSSGSGTVRPSALALVLEWRTRDSIEPPMPNNHEMRAVAQDVSTAGTRLYRERS